VKKLKIKETQRVLVYKDGKIHKFLNPGLHRFWRLWKYEFEYFDITIPEFTTNWTNIIIKNHPHIVEQNFELINVKDNQVAVVFLDGKLYKVFEPGSTTLIWKIINTVSVEYIDISEYFEIPKNKTQLFTKMLKESDQIKNFVVPEAHQGLLYVNGNLIKTLVAGTFAFFKGQNSIEVFIVDIRLQGLEVQGQEILTKDRVSIRLNFEATYKIVDSKKAVTTVKNFEDYLYKELQLSLRKAVSNKTLDELLEEKESLAGDIKTFSGERIKTAGLELVSTGVKDIILPGDMRAILNKVVLAQKEAQANNIKRREEVAATRSLLNTAKLIENNPTMMRLRELEAIENITQKVEKLNIYGGLNELLGQIIPK